MSGDLDFCSVISIEAIGEGMRVCLDLVDVLSLHAGDRLLFHPDVPGRHLGRPIDEVIREN